MNPKVYCLVLLIMILVGCEKKVTRHYENGELKDTYTWRNQMKEGEYLQYYANGVLKSRRYCVHDTLNGPAEMFDSVGNLVLRGQYVAGRMHGPFAAYHPNRMISSVGRFENGLKQGLIRHFSEEGKRTREVWFSNNLMFYDKEYDSNGSVLSTSMELTNIDTATLEFPTINAENEASGLPNIRIVSLSGGSLPLELWTMKVNGKITILQRGTYRIEFNDPPGATIMLKDDKGIYAARSVKI